MPPLLAFFLRRIVTALPVLAVVLVGSFLLLEAAPGDAVDAYVAQSGAMDADQLAQLRQGRDEAGQRKEFSIGEAVHRHFLLGPLHLLSVVFRQK